MRELFKSPIGLALAAALICVVTATTQVFDHAYLNAWYKINSDPAPKTSMIVSLDGGSVDSTESVLGSTAKQARLVSRLVELGASHIYFDFPASAGADAVGDAALYDAIAKAGDRITMVNRGKVVAGNYSSVLSQPIFLPPPLTQVAVSSWDVNFRGIARSSPKVIESAGQAIPVVSYIAAKGAKTDNIIYPDFRVNPSDIDIVNSKYFTGISVIKNDISEKNIYVTTTNTNWQTTIGYFGHGRVPAAAVDISGAIGLSKGGALRLTGDPLLFIFLLLLLIGNRIRRASAKTAFYGALVAFIVVAPGILADHRVFAEIGSTFAAALAYGPARLWQKWRRQVQLTSTVSGLPNIEALAAGGIPPGYDVIAVTVGHYDQMLASMPGELHGECARQIARRLSLTATGSPVHDTNNGCFVWLAQPDSIETLVGQFEGLKAMFSAPMLIDSRVLDTSLHFGIDRNGESRPMSRIKSALVSAAEAQDKGKLYEEFSRQRLAETPWELSLHARIDAALRNGDMWLAFQGQYDFGSGRITGAEILIRWNDPERGVIPPDSFIIQAERAGRINAITYWVLDRAILASLSLEESFGLMQLSVNLSGQMVDQPGLVSDISDIVRRHDFDCSRLTLEVTETFNMANRDMARSNLASLRAMGFRLSVDDFGTGHASLAHLSDIPSDEIKLDRRFIQAIVGDARDRTIVRSTIQLAHALGQVVVAEGVEDLATLDLLRQLDCDSAQGYFIGYPVSFDAFVTALRNVPAAGADRKDMIKAC